MFNVLITSAGRRVELVQLFKSAAQRLGLNSKIIAADCSTLAPALYFADKGYIVPSLSCGEYIDRLIHICRSEHVSAIVPTIDTELMLMAENKRHIESECNAKVIISDSEVIRICRDKQQTHDFLKKNGFSVPVLYSEREIESGEVCFPAFIKPRDGSSSINANKVVSEHELAFWRNKLCNYMVESFIDGQEYSVDVFTSMSSGIISVVPRLRIATRSGEIAKGRIVRDERIVEDVCRLIKLLKPVGHITVQLIKNNESLVYLEINPRFGGGAPMSIMAGADSCEFILRILQGEELSYRDYVQREPLFLRFDQTVLVDESVSLHE